MTYHCELTGSPHKKIDIAVANADGINGAIQYALGAMLDIYERDDLHRDDLGRFVGAKDLLMACGFALRHINANPVPTLPSPENRNKFNMLDKIVSKRNAWKY